MLPAHGVICCMQPTSFTEEEEEEENKAASALLMAVAAFCAALSVTACCEALILWRHKEPTVWNRDPGTRRRQVAAPAGNPWKLEGAGWEGGTGGADDHGNQRQAWTKAGVISAVWVTNCWTSGLNGLSWRKTADKEANK